jgi:DNA recombination protein Rad52
MTFTANQVRKLRSKLRPQHVRVRETEGQTLHYLEGWHVVAEANRIFGFDAWDRETVSNSCVWTKQIAGRYCAAYVARVRITVRAGKAVIVREGSGAGESNEATPGQAHDRASKAAETDATKRALTTFGNSFGLTLYAGLTDSERRAARSKNGEAQGLSSKAASDRNQHNVEDQNTISQDAVAMASLDGEVGPRVSIQEHTDTLGELHGVNGVEGETGGSQGHGKIDKSVLAIPEPRRIRDPEHLKYVAERPCMICGRQPCEAHHLRHAQPRALGRKSSDSYTVPLCALHHRELHARGDEAAWWQGKGRDPFPVADELWRHSRSN